MENVLLEARSINMRYGNNNVLSNVYIHNGKASNFSYNSIGFYCSSTCCCLYCSEKQKTEEKEGATWKRIKAKKSEGNILISYL